MVCARSVRQCSPGAPVESWTALSRVHHRRRDSVRALPMVRAVQATTTRGVAFKQSGGCDCPKGAPNEEPVVHPTGHSYRHLLAFLLLTLASCAHRAKPIEPLAPRAGVQ